MCIHKLPTCTHTHTHTAVCYSNAAVFNSTERHQGVLKDVSVREIKCEGNYRAIYCMLQTNCMSNCRSSTRLLLDLAPMALTVITNSYAHSGSESKDSGTCSDSGGQLAELQPHQDALTCHFFSTESIPLYILIGR